jgi:hypothetical protein
MTKHRLVVLTDAQIELIRYHAEDEHIYFTNLHKQDKDSLKVWSDWLSIKNALENAQNG